MAIGYRLCHVNLELLLALREDATSRNDAAAPATTKLVGAAPVTCIKALKTNERRYLCLRKIRL